MLAGLSFGCGQLLELAAGAKLPRPLRVPVGLTVVILCVEIDLSVAAIANATGIVVAYFTLQESYVTIANVPSLPHRRPARS